MLGLTRLETEVADQTSVAGRMLRLMLTPLMGLEKSGDWVGCCGWGHLESRCAPEAGVLAILLEDAQDEADPLDDDALGLVGVQRVLSMK